MCSPHTNAPEGNLSACSKQNDPALLNKLCLAYLLQTCHLKAEPTEPVCVTFMVVPIVISYITITPLVKLKLLLKPSFKLGLSASLAVEIDWFVAGFRRPKSLK